QVGGVRVVAAEQLVAALAGERDLHVLRRQLRDEICRQRGGVGERLVESRRERREQQRRIGAQYELAVQRAVALGDPPGVGELVEGAFREPDRERVQRLGALLGGERGQQPRGR